MSVVNLDSVMDCGDPRRQFPTNFYISYNTEVAEFVLKSIYIYEIVVTKSSLLTYTNIITIILNLQYPFWTKRVRMSAVERSAYLSEDVMPSS